MCKAEGEQESFSPKSPLNPSPVAPPSSEHSPPSTGRDPALGTAARDAIGIEVLLSYLFSVALRPMIFFFFLPIGLIIDKDLEFGMN